MLWDNYQIVGNWITTPKGNKIHKNLLDNIEYYGQLHREMGWQAAMNTRSRNPQGEDILKGLEIEELLTVAEC